MVAARATALTEDALSPAEFSALKALLQVDIGDVRDAAALRSLLAKGYVRREADGIAVTVPGHLRYLRQLWQSVDDWKPLN